MWNSTCRAKKSKTQSGHQLQPFYFCRITLSKELSQRLSAEEALTALDSLSISDAEEESKLLQVPQESASFEPLDMAETHTVRQVGFWHL